MKAVSINAGPLQPMNIQGDAAKTGFYKSAVKGPVRVVKNGLVGDSRVACARDLNRAVFFYQAHHYEWWRKELKRDIPFAMFGENVTFEGPDDNQFYLGDVLRMGSATFCITQPRHPCIKIGIKMGDASFPAKYLKSGRLGFHCSVVEEGYIQEGDQINVIHRENNPYPLPAFTKAIFLEPRDVPGLERMLAAPALVPEWRIRTERLWRKQTGANGWQEYRPLSVTNRREESADVVSFDLDDPAGEELPRFEAGQFLTLQLDVGGNASPLVRTYTVTGRSASGRGYSYSVKREPIDVRNGVLSGRGSTFVCDTVREGHTIKALPPRGTFIVEPGSRPIVLLSAGIGITPMVAMLEQLSSCPLRRDVYFIHGAKSTFLHRYVKYSRPCSSDVAGRDFDAVGRLNVSDIERCLPSLDADYYVCGPAAFMKDIILALVERGIEKDRIHFEFFGSSVPLFGECQTEDHGDPLLDANGEPIMVTFARSELTVSWTGNLPSLLILAEHSGLRPAQSCRNGLCEVCICRLDAGEVEHDGEIINPPKEGDVMICCARPKTSVMVDI
jgi:ferredoxin-NADP reductase/MOSC domain-containing protein YiiM